MYSSGLKVFIVMNLLIKSKYQNGAQHQTYSVTLSHAYMTEGDSVGYVTHHWVVFSFGYILYIKANIEKD